MTNPAPASSTAANARRPAWRDPVLLVWHGPGAAAAAQPDPDAAKAWATAVTLAGWVDGHGLHGGLRGGPGPRQISCRCGVVLYEVGAIEGAAA